MQSKRDRHQSLINDRLAKADQLDALRAEQSAALIEGTEFTRGGDIRSLSDEIQALDSAIAVASDAAEDEERRQRAAANIEGWQADLAQMKADSEGYLQAAAKVEVAMASVVAGLAEMLSLATKMETFAKRASGIGQISALSHTGIGIRTSERMARQLAPLDPQSIGAFGIIRWQAMQQGLTQDWVAEERKQLDSFIPYVKRKSEEYIADQTAIAKGE